MNSKTISVMTANNPTNSTKFNSFDASMIIFISIHKQYYRWKMVEEKISDSQNESVLYIDLVVYFAISWMCVMLSRFLSNISRIHAHNKNVQTKRVVLKIIEHMSAVKNSF